MEEKPVRQGVPLRQVKAKKEFSTLAGHYMMLAFMVPLYLAYILWLSEGIPILVLVHPYTWLWVAYLAYVLAYKRRYHLFIAGDGLYVVRRGYAVRIPWEKVMEAKHHVGFRTNYIAMVFAPDLTDEKTGTPFVWQDENELHIQYRIRRAGKCFRKHVQVTEVKGLVRVK